MTKPTLAEIQSELQQLMPKLKTRFGIEKIEIFGSYIRQQQTQKSDIDLLVTFNKAYSLWQLIDAERYLQRKLSVKVDLVPADSVKPALKNQIFSEATAVWAVQTTGC